MLVGFYKQYLVRSRTPAPNTNVVKTPAVLITKENDLCFTRNKK